MDPTGLAVAGAGLILFCTYLWRQYSRPDGFPPGPPNLPLVGSLPFLVGGKSGDIATRVEGLHEKYGNIFSFRLGQRWTVVLCDYDSIKEAMLTKGKEFGGRPDAHIDRLIRPTFPEIKGIIIDSYSEEWKQQRHASLTALRDLGYGKAATENKMLQEADYLKQAFQIQEGKESFDPAEHITNAVANIIIALLVNQRYDYDDPIFKSLRLAIDLHFEHLRQDVETLPIQRYFPSFTKFKKEALQTYSVVLDFLRNHMKGKQEAIEADEPPTSFIESYKKTVNSSEGRMQDWTLPIMEDFIRAGMETTTTTLGWGVYFMVGYPEVQRKVQEELDRVVGPGCQPTLKDRARLPYTEATLQELLRLATTAPSALPHVTMSDTEVQGYKIPKGVEVLGFLWLLHRSPKYWPDPLVFRPERFLDENGQAIKLEKFIPFGIGRRVCLGEQLARQELFIFFTAMVHSFTLSLPEGATLPPPKGHIAITHRPPPLKICVKMR